MSDDGMRHVGAMTDLESLLLYSTAVTDRGVGELAGLARLRHLNLHVTGGIGEAGLKVVCRLGGLESLVLRLDPAVTEDAVRGLSALPKLRTLHVTKPNLEEAEVARLRTAMRACAITWRSRD